MLEQGNRMGLFVPECKEDGSYAEVQCHVSTGYCWCVDEAGKPIRGSSIQNARPNCAQKGAKRTNRRRSSRGKKNKKGCGTSDRAAFNSNLIDIFQSEYDRVPHTTTTTDEQVNAVAGFLDDAPKMDDDSTQATLPVKPDDWDKEDHMPRLRHDGHSAAKQDTSDEESKDGCSLHKKQEFLDELVKSFIQEMQEDAKNRSVSIDIPTPEKAARWKFASIDANSNSALDKREWKIFKKEWRTFQKDSKQKKRLRKCWRNLPRFCDENDNQKITIDEWLACTSITRDFKGVLPRNPRKGKNPFSTILKSD
ncbi:SPARC-related modular calcium-binding protein like [Argiope bruennichi]|uniref:SPARC-related modular calcium-binding protein like n=1 Tax=Argiope bruennichi TaxID=94029 RepID=A0A8T0FB96_ARGBR|nr:SPARC-related modular calcium-binding protein like [Argiope bruennichi]